MLWIIKLLLPSVLSWIEGYLKAKQANQEAMQKYQDFVKILTSNGLMSTTLKEDYDSQKPPV